MKISSIVIHEYEISSGLMDLLFNSLNFKMIMEYSQPSVSSIFTSWIQPTRNWKFFFFSFLKVPKSKHLNLLNTGNHLHSIYIVLGIRRWRRQWQPTPVLLPGKSHGWRSLVGCSPWGREESDTTERLHFHFSLSCIREGNGNPLQCSCLENPRDGRAWRAVYGVAQSRTRLKWLSSSSSIGQPRCLSG